MKIISSTDPLPRNRLSSNRSAPVLLLLPGQGAQRTSMGSALYGAEPTFTAAMDDVFERMGTEGRNIRSDWLGRNTCVPLDDTTRAQPLLFAVNRAVGLTIAAHGLPPALLLGHSIGELAAACLADVFDIDLAAQLLLARAAATVDTPPGGMIAVAAAAADLTDLTQRNNSQSDLAIAAVNGQRQTVLSGTADALTRARLWLSDAGLVFRDVAARQPFHSPMMNSAVPRLARVLAGTCLRPPTIPIQSTRTGRLVSDREATTPEFWAGQVATPVLFWAALDAALNSGAWTVVESSPSPELAVAADRHRSVRQGRSTVHALPLPGPGICPNAWIDRIEALASHLQAAA